MLRFFFSPFIFVYEVIAFVIQAAFVYGLVLIAAFSMLAWVITSNPQPQVEYVHSTKIVEVEVEVDNSPELVCKRLSGCEIVSDAKTEEEYCPTCVWDK